MIAFRVDRRMFFDRKPVMSAVDKTTRQVLSRFGAYVRTRARSSIRRRKSISKPDQAPTSQTGVLKAGIVFGYDKRAQTVVIGPMPLNQKRAGTGWKTLQALEEGGYSTLAEGPWSRRRGARTRRRTRQIYVEARPFMQPAFDKEKKNLPDMWQNSIG